MPWLDDFIDMTARKPGGMLGRAIYRESRSHRTAFNLLKDKLNLQPTDHVLEVGCGGGVLLYELLETANRGAAIDHSKDMIELAAQRNADAIRENRLDLRLGDVYNLPWNSALFDAVASTNMFFFIEDPVRMLQEIWRVLTPGGRLVMVTMAPSKIPRLLFLPYAHAMRSYSEEELSAMLNQANFIDIRISTESLLMQAVWAHKSS